MSGRSAARAGAVVLTAKENGKTYLTTAGAAAVLGRSRAFVRLVVHRPIGKDGVGLRPYGRGRRYLFKREDVVRFGNGEPMTFADWWRKRERKRKRGSGTRSA